MQRLEVKDNERVVATGGAAKGMAKLCAWLVTEQAVFSPGRSTDTRHDHKRPDIALLSILLSPSWCRAHSLA